MSARLVGMLLVACSAVAGAQDSSFSVLRVRASVFRNPLAGHIGDDWSAGTGARGEIGTNVGKTELALGVGHLKYTSTSGKPDYSATIFSLTWTAPVVAISRANAWLGAQLSDYRMDFNDPSLVGGLRTEEEVMVSAVGRGRIAVGGRWSLVGDVSGGVLMLGTHTTMVLVHAGVERELGTPAWLRNFLR